MKRLASTGGGEQAEAHRRERDDHRLERADLPEPGERRFDGDRRRLRILDHLAEHVLLLELAAGRLRQPEREEREDRDRDPEEEERPAPAVVAAGERGDAGDDDRTEHRRRGGAPIAIDAPIRPRTPIGYVSASIDPCTGSVFDFATPTPSRAQNSWNAFTRSRTR